MKFLLIGVPDSKFDEFRRVEVSTEIMTWVYENVIGGWAMMLGDREETVDRFCSHTAYPLTAVTDDDLIRMLEQVRECIWRFMQDAKPHNYVKVSELPDKINLILRGRPYDDVK
jgi:hypothetical protein